MIEINKNRLMTYILSNLKTSTQTQTEKGYNIPLWMMVYSKEYIETMDYLKGKDSNEKESINKG